MTRLLLALATAALLAGCGSDAGSDTGSDTGSASGARSTATEAQACEQAEQVTDAYQDGLKKATTPQDARAVIGDAVSGLRDIDAPQPLSDRVTALADALSDLREGVEAGRPPAELQPQAAAVGTSATALARQCGRDGGGAP